MNLHLSCLLFIEFGCTMPDQNSKLGKEFANLLQQVFVHNKSNQWSVKDVARGMGLKEATFRSRFNAEERRTQISPEEIKSLLKVAPDLQLINYFLEDTPYMAAEKAPIPESGKKDPKVLRARADITVEEAADVIRQVR